MTFEIAAVLGILAVSLVLFVTEKLRMDVVALLVLGTVAASGLVSLEESLAGFSNPAVVTVWAMFILSAGLSATGVADMIGQRVLALAGRSEGRILMVIMLTTGVLSAFMNNIGVAALMLPVVMDIARRTGTSPSRLLMPMAYASLLGGLTTMVGTPPNLVASNALEQADLEGFSLFEFTPIGLPALVAGSIFIALFGRRILPSKMPEGMEGSSAAEAGAGTGKLRFSYKLSDRRFRLRLTDDSPLAGRTLAECALTATLGLNVLSIQRGDQTITHLDGTSVLEAGDVLTAQGRVEDFHEFLSWQAMEMASGDEIFEVLSRDKVAVMRATVAADSKFVGLTVQETRFRSRFHANIRAVRRGDRTIREGIPSVQIEAGDTLILEGRRDVIDGLLSKPEFSETRLLDREHLSEVYPSDYSLIELRIPNDSALSGISIAESGLGDSLRLYVVGIARKSGSLYFPEAEECFQTGDQLLVSGPPESLELMRGIKSLNLLDEAEAEQPGGGAPDGEALVEATLSPDSTVVGRSMRELDFRKRYGFLVLSVWRRGRAYRSHLRNLRLQLGDALLLSGPPEHIERLGKDPDFIVLTQRGPREKPVTTPHRAVLASFFMLAVVISVLVGWLHIAIAAVIGAALMITTRCLSMEQAYRAIDWKSVFLIAGMIPLGTAMDQSGAAKWIAEGVSTVAEPLGLWGILAAIYLLTALATTIVPTTALVLIMAPIAIETSGEMGLDPKLLMMGVAMAASASFTSPISHPANVLVMGPGGYRFVDYVKMGAVLAIVVMITVLPLIVWRYG